MWNLEIIPLAQIDVQDISDYYKRISIKLRDKFLSDLRVYLENIQSNPKAFQLKYKEVRVVFFKRFPYGIFYKIYDNNIKVIAVVHTSRNPKVWKNR